VRIVPLTTNFGIDGAVMLRAGVRLGPAPGECSLAAPDCAAGQTATWDGTDWVCTGCAAGSAKAGVGAEPCTPCVLWDEASSCPSGQGCYNFLETYGSAAFSEYLFYDGFDFNNPALDDPIGWRSETNPSTDFAGEHWVALDTGLRPRLIVGVVTQGEGYDENHFTTLFTVEWSLDGASWTEVDFGERERFFS